MGKSLINIKLYMFNPFNNKNEKQNYNILFDEQSLFSNTQFACNLSEHIDLYNQ